MLFEISDTKLDRVIIKAMAHNDDLDANTIENFVFENWHEGQEHQD